MNAADVPDTLADREQWITWRTECRECGQRLDPTVKLCECGEKATKKPIDPNGDGFASSTDADTWAELKTSVKYAENHDVDGVGFVFKANGQQAGVDLDDCRDPETGEIDDWAREVVDRLDSFTEVSPSGTGLHVYVLGFVPDGGNRADVAGGEIEMYDDGRYFTVTADGLSETPATVEQRNDALGELHAEHIAEDDGDDEAQGHNSGASGGFDGTDRELIEKAKNAKNGEKFARLWRGDISGYPSHSEARQALANLLAFWTGGDEQRMLDLFRQSDLCRGDDDIRTFENYETPTALQGRTEFYQPKATADGGAAAASVGGGPAGGDDATLEKFRDACHHYHLNPDRVTFRKVDGEKQPVGLSEVLPRTGIADAVLMFNREAENFNGTDRQAVVGRVVYLDLQERGEFFKTADGRLFYFHEEERDVYRVDGQGNRILGEEFQGFAWDRYNLFAGQFSRNLGEDIRSQAKREAPEKDVYQFAHFDPDASELYVSDWGSGYYAVSPEGIEWRPNGTDVYFLPDDSAAAFEYLEPEERPELPDRLAGERPLWGGSGDPIMRLFGNRINYDESAALGPSEQRKQLYLHLHSLPFIDLLNSRPIMAWVGEKGSGKTVIQRSVGRFVYGDDFTESIMPDAKDDFLAKVTNQALAFVDNYDDGEDWANDVLAAIATGAGLDKRELYTTNSLRQEQPRCWLSITSRDPPFRRDDVADRTIVFRVERLPEPSEDGDGGFIGMGDFLRQVGEYRDLAWSVYLDNLQAAVAEYAQRETGTMSSAHRMADWAIFAKIVADALDVDGVDELLEMMETERATFALENETWAAVIGDWAGNDPEDAATWRKAGSLVDRLAEKAEAQNRAWHLNKPHTLGTKLTNYHTELSELYGLEIDESGRVNKYRFDTRDDDGTPTGLARF